MDQRSTGRDDSDAHTHYLMSQLSLHNKPETNASHRTIKYLETLYSPSPVWVFNAFVGSISAEATYW
jgi:hypothetical protein